METPDGYARRGRIAAVPIRRAIPFQLIVFGLVLAATAASAETLFVEGRMHGRITIEIAETYIPAPGTEWLSLKFYRTPSFVSPTWKQTVIADEVTYASLRPAESSSSRDDLGNVVLTEKWLRPPGAVELTRRVTVDTNVPLTNVASRSPFPLGAVAPEAERFRRPGRLTPSDDPRLRDLARRLTGRSTTERDAVSAILNHVADHLKYRYDPPAHDAIFALEHGLANCQGYAHLALSLLRAAGIPARLAVGLSLSKGWRVPNADGSLTFKMGQGRHAWIEVFYPDLGWVPYDPQMSQLFVSLYHVRQGVALDVAESANLVVAAPALPRIAEAIRGDGANEHFALTTTSRGPSPRGFIMAAAVTDLLAAVPPPRPASPPPVASPRPSPAPPTVTPVVPLSPPPTAAPRAISGIPRHELTKLVEFGNTDFPASLRIFGAPQTIGSTGAVQARRTFIVETADYATGPDELAQAFSLDAPLVLSQISLALQKFGGVTGELWVDLFDDRARKPGALIASSRRLPVGGLVERGGYRWVVFDVLPETQGPLLSPGRYWVVLRSSGDGIFNWYFSPGSAYGEPDDTRARARNTPDWNNVLNYRFNFRITGLVKP
jgi:hypothetical protein